jgi:hypothetical protein
VNLTETDLLVLVGFLLLGLLAVAFMGSYPIGLVAVSGMVLTVLNAFLRSRGRSTEAS